MSKSVKIIVDLSVKDDAQPFAVADWVFDRLVNDEESPESIESVDGTMPSLG